MEKIGPPYYAVIFTSLREQASSEYDEMSGKMEKLSLAQPGFLGIQSARDSKGFGITVSYWRTLEDIKNWKANTEHLKAQAQGKAQWYSEYEVRISKVEREYKFEAPFR
jgi:heme-degrading monooxygenase HmoA